MCRLRLSGNAVKKQPAEAPAPSLHSLSSQLLFLRRTTVASGHWPDSEEQTWFQAQGGTAAEEPSKEDDGASNRAKSNRTWLHFYARMFVETLSAPAPGIIKWQDKGF